MTDEKIKEEFEKFEKAFDWEQEYDNYKAIFTSGFRAAERLAKIEVLEELRDAIARKNLSRYGIDCYITKTISELKAGQ